MKLKTLLEKFETSLKAESGRGPYTEVFRNPTPKEFLEASKEVAGKPYIRFIAPKDGSTLFVFRPDVFHDGVYEHLEEKKLVSGWSRANLWGTAVFEKGKWVFDGSDEGVPKGFNWKALQKKGIHYSTRDQSVNPAEMKEAFEFGVKHPLTKEYTEIFSNPTAKEMTEAARKIRGKVYVRFIADSSQKKLYVFSPLIIHRHISKKLGRGEHPKKGTVWGVAEKKRGGWEAVSSDFIGDVSERAQDAIDSEWDWVNSKIDMRPLIAKMKKSKNVESGELEPMNLRSRAKRLVPPRKVEESLNLFVEEFAGADKTEYGNYVEIFVNPTSKEMQELPGQLRYAIDGRDDKVKVYVWDGDLLHGDASKVIKVPYPHSQVLWGIGKKQGNKVISRGGIYPARNQLGRYKYLQSRMKPDAFAKELKRLQEIAKTYLDPKWENRWVDLSDFKEAVQEIVDEKIDEAFAAGIKTRQNKYYEIFKNPTRKEMQELPQDVRFLIDARKGEPDVYVWPSNLLHMEAARELKMPYPPTIDNMMIYGAGEKSGIQIKATDSFHINEYMDFLLDLRSEKKDSRMINKEAKRMQVYLGPKFENQYIYLGPVQREIRDFLSNYFNINEAFETYAGKGEDTVIFKNPTAGEMREFGQYLRFLIRNRNGKNTVYVFSDGLMHAKAADELGISYPHDPNVLAGIAIRSGKEWKMNDSFNLRSMLGKSVHNYMKMLETDWSNPYIDVKDYMTKQARKKVR